MNNDLLQEIVNYSTVNTFDGENFNSIYPYSNGSDYPNWISPNYGFIDSNSNENIYLRREMLSDYVTLEDLLNQNESEYLFEITIEGHQFQPDPNSLTTVPILLDTDTKFFRFKMAE